MLAIRSQKNSLEIFELEEEDVTRLKQSIMNLNGNFQKSRLAAVSKHFQTVPVHISGL